MRLNFGINSIRLKVMRSFMVLWVLGIFSPVVQAEPLRALLVCGGCCHDYAKQSVILCAGIQARANVRVDVVRSLDKGTKAWFTMYENKDWARGYDVSSTMSVQRISRMPITSVTF